MCSFFSLCSYFYSGFCDYFASWLVLGFGGIYYNTTDTLNSTTTTTIEYHCHPWKISLNTVRAIGRKCLKTVLSLLFGNENSNKKFLCVLCSVVVCFVWRLKYHTNSHVDAHKLSLQFRKNRDLFLTFFIHYTFLSYGLPTIFLERLHRKYLFSVTRKIAWCRWH